MASLPSNAQHAKSDLQNRFQEVILLHTRPMSVSQEVNNLKKSKHRQGFPKQFKLKQFFDCYVRWRLA